MSKGFVTFTDTYFVPLVKVLAQSLLAFSKYPLHIFLINSNEEIISPNVILTKIKIPEKNHHQYLMYSKFYAAFKNNFDFGCVIDADAIANINIDGLLDFAELYCKDFPLCAFHGNNINDTKLMAYLDVEEQSTPYLHATYLFSEKSKTFLKECFDISQDLMNKNIVPAGSDEILLNILLWKNKIKNYLNAYDPFYKSFYSYLNSERDDFTKDRGDVSFHFFHGCKDVKESLDILDKLKQQDRGEFSANKFKSNGLKIYGS